MLKLKERDKRRLVYITLAAILAFDVLYGIIFVSGPTNLSEEYAYAHLALNAIHGQVNLQWLDASRLLQYLPIAAFYEAFGVGIYTSSAWNTICFVGIVLIAFLVGRELYGANTGLLSALLASFFTPIVRVSSTLDIVMPMAFFVSLALLALLYGHNRKSGRWMFAGGVFLVATQLTIPIGLIAVVAGLLYVIIELARRKLSFGLVMYMVAGIAAASLVVLAFSYYVSGSPLTIANLNGAYYSNLTMTDTIYGIIGAPVVYANGSANSLFGWYLPYYPEQMFEYSATQALIGGITHNSISLSTVWQQLYNPGLTAGFYFYAVIIAMAYLLLKWDRRLYFPLIWFAIGFLFLQFAPQGGTLSPFRYILIFRYVRYLTVLVVPTTVIISMGLVRFSGIRKHLKSRSMDKSRKLKLSIAIAIVLFLILTSIPANALWRNYIYTEYYPLRFIANIVLHAGPNITVYYPSDDWPDMIVYTHDSKSINLIMLDGISNCSRFQAGSYVIIPNVTDSFAPSWSYIVNTSKYCPNFHLVAAPYSDAYNQSGIPLKNQQKLYYVEP